MAGKKQSSSTIEAKLEETYRNATNNEPGEAVGTIVSDNDRPAAIADIQSAGYVKLYNTRTREAVTINKNALKAHLSRRHNDPNFPDYLGKYAFTSDEPDEPPFRGKFPCLLHKDSIYRKDFDELGLPNCAAGHLRDSFQVDLHMKHKHKAEWAAIESRKLQAEKDEEKLFRHTMFEAIAKK